jgi:hypothetical protein
LLAEFHKRLPKNALAVEVIKTISRGAVGAGLAYRLQGLCGGSVRAPARNVMSSRR